MQIMRQLLRDILQAAEQKKHGNKQLVANSYVHPLKTKLSWPYMMILSLTEFYEFTEKMHLSFFPIAFQRRYETYSSKWRNAGAFKGPKK